MCKCYALNGPWSCFSMKILSKEKLILPILLMILILNPERIVYLDVKCRSL
jgi:hypothetical protein